MVTGGVAYTLGVLFFAVDKVRYAHFSGIYSSWRAPGRTLWSSGATCIDSAGGLRDFSGTLISFQTCPS